MIKGETTHTGSLSHYFLHERIENDSKSPLIKSNETTLLKNHYYFKLLMSPIPSDLSHSTISLFKKLLDFICQHVLKQETSPLNFLLDIFAAIFLKVYSVNHKVF